MSKELAQAFYPCTDDGLVDSWHGLNMSINKIRKERDDIAAILLDKSVKGADMSIEEPWRVGKLIEGKDVKVQAIWRLVDSMPRRWKASLEYVEE